MSSTKELRGRIKSIRNTAKVTKAMQLVSAAKMRRAQEQALNGRSYSELINRVLDSIAPNIDPTSHPLLQKEVDEKEKTKTRRELILLVSTNRGLNGAMNTNLFRLVWDKSNSSFVTMGKKGEVFLSKTGKDLVADFVLEEKPSLQEAKTVAGYLMKSYLEEDFEKVSIAYTKFISTLKQEPAIRQILPILNEELFSRSALQEKVEEYLFEPSPDLVLETILPHYIEMEVYQVLLEASASEHSARMVAMKNATDNANELVDDLTLVYNGLRQANITNEILDITTAAVALE
jgi:F-type H+-transporting ATPase subunit gamma